MTGSEGQGGLPIAACRDKLVAAFNAHACLLVIGETGSGKTTQIPQYLLAEHHGDRRFRIAITQPRRVAAMALARRVADEMGVELGKTVGYSVRFEEMASRETRIKFLTDGMLLREALSDNTLSRYSVIILDEAHERTLRSDILLGMVKRIMQQRRTGLKLVIMSATIDPRKFLAFFPNGNSVFAVPGRQFPVRLFYTAEPQQDYLDAAIVSIVQVHGEKPPGDILVFLTGQEEIEAVQRILEENRKFLPKTAPRLLVCPIFASLPAGQQMAAFKRAPHGCRKVVLATNIAETSITIPGIRYVIDPGFVKQRQYSSKTGMESLAVVPCSQSSARQRSGRAGREAPGECYRLYREDMFATLPAETPPEILRTNLSNAILVMKASGVDDVVGFDYLDAPSMECLKRGLEGLLALGALDRQGGLSRVGAVMAECPLVPTLSRILLESVRLACTDSILAILSMLSADNLFVGTASEREHASAARRLFLDKSGDHLTYLNIFRAFEAIAANEQPRWATQNFMSVRALRLAVDVRAQLQHFCQKHGISTAPALADNDAFAILRCLTSGYFMQAAFRQADSSYQNVLSRQLVHIHPSSVLFGTKPECIVYHELTLTTRCYLRGVSSVSPEWVLEYGRGAAASGAAVLK